ncbi:MAG TPA: hypothetical protein VF877_02615 [Gaiellaceae bacterium]
MKSGSPLASRPPHAVTTPAARETVRQRTTARVGIDLLSGTRSSGSRHRLDAEVFARGELDEGIAGFDEALAVANSAEVWGSPKRKPGSGERRWDMYIGLGTVLLIILIVLLVVYVF